MSLAKSGFYSGNPQLVLDAPISIVLDTYYYELFTQEYQDCYIELNKEKENKKK